VDRTPITKRLGESARILRTLLPFGQRLLEDAVGGVHFAFDRIIAVLKGDPTAFSEGETPDPPPSSGIAGSAARDGVARARAESLREDTEYLALNRFEVAALAPETVHALATAKRCAAQVERLSFARDMLVEAIHRALNPKVLETKGVRWKAPASMDARAIVAITSDITSENWKMCECGDYLFAHGPDGCLRCGCEKKHTATAA
jgi:hypothetical protein